MFLEGIQVELGKCGAKGSSVHLLRGCIRRCLYLPSFPDTGPFDVDGRGMGMRGGAVFHMSPISAGVRPQARCHEVAARALQFQRFGGE